MQKNSEQYLLTVILIFAIAMPTAIADTNDTELAQTILEKADQIRFPRDSFQVDVTINTTAPGQPEDVRKYRVLSKGNENSVVMTTEPAS